MSLQLANADEFDRIQRDRLCAQSWAGPLTIDQFLIRENRLRSTNWASQSLRTWLLKNETNETLSSCETYEMQSVLNKKKGISFGIASVFTAESLRGQGYASQMLRMVLQKLEATHDNIHGFVLYSEVGEAIYQRLGFQACPSFDWVVSATATLPPAPSAQVFHSGDDFQYELQMIAKHHAAHSFHIAASMNQIQWFEEREKVLAHLLNRPTIQIRACKSEDSFAVWMADFKDQCLRALIFEASSPQSALALVIPAQKEAQRLGLPLLRIWERPTLQCPDWAKRESRPDDIAMLRPAEQTKDELKASDWNWIDHIFWV